MADLDPSPSNWLAQEQERRLVIQALRQIPVELQVTLELFYWEGMAGAELAQPHGTVAPPASATRQSASGAS